MKQLVTALLAAVVGGCETRQPTPTPSTGADNFYGGGPSSGRPGGTDGGMGNPADGGGTPGPSVDTSVQGLTALAKALSYRSWRGEPANHPSAGAHRAGRGYFNDVLYGSIKGASQVHPRGSVAVFDTVDSNGYLVEQAILAKDSATSEWVFFLGVPPAYAAPTYHRGITNPCAGCHMGGADYVWTRAGALP